MALIVKDRVLENSTTTGTGAFTLTGAHSGYRAFSSVCSTNDNCYYTIVAVDANGNPSGDWECGLGTYSGTNTLTRTTPQASSNSGSAVNFAAGTKHVSLDATATYLANLAVSASGSVSIVQQKSFIGNNPTMTLDATPTAGNQLVVMGTHWSNFGSITSGWSTILLTNAATFDGLLAFVKVVTAADAASATIAMPVAFANNGCSISIFEVSGALPIVSLMSASYQEFSGKTKSMEVASPKNGSAIIGFTSTISNNTAPSSVSNVTTGTTVTGTSTSGAPRQITPFTKTNVSAGTAVTITSTYASTVNQYGIAYVMSPV